MISFSDVGEILPDILCSCGRCFVIFLVKIIHPKSEGDGMAHGTGTSMMPVVWASN